MTISCIKIDLEKQIIFRAKRLIRVGVTLFLRKLDIELLLLPCFCPFFHLSILFPFNYFATLATIL